MKSKYLIFGLIFLFIIFLVGFFVWFFLNLKPIGNGKMVMLEIKVGTGYKTIAANLEDKGVIKSKRAFEIYVLLTGNFNKIKADKVRGEGKLVMQWDEDLFSVENRGDDIGYYINHSCDPNLWMQDAYTLVAKRDIEEGEEITADYALWEADENYVSKWKCSCGLSFCRKRITGKDWRLPGLQKRYKGHFSPLINKRISRLI